MRRSRFAPLLLALGLVLLAGPARGERGRRLLTLEAQRPPEVRAAQAAAQAAIDLRRDEASLRAQAAGDAEIHHLREERFGTDAAERIRVRRLETSEPVPGAP